MYDVIDHCIDPSLTMTKVKSVIDISGRIYLRTHPYCSRFGAHQKTNKAFSHLVFTETELANLGETNPCPLKIFNPLSNYHYWFQGLDVQWEIPIKHDIEDFFQKEILSKRLVQYNYSNMEINFVDYKLVPNKEILVF